MTIARRPLAVIVWWLLLLGTLILWWLDSVDRSFAVTDLVVPALLLPLVIGLVPVARGSAKATAAATLLLIPYLGWGLTEILANPAGRIFAGLTVLFGFACFGALILQLRKLRSG